MRAVLVLAACALTVSCTPLQAPALRGVIQVPSPNFDERWPSYVIIHHTSERTAAAALAILRDPERKVSAHYLIARDGTIYQMVSETRRAWHAGASYWAGNTDLNSASIGIELDNDGAGEFSEAQIVRLLDVLRTLKERYRIPPANFLGHGDIAPARKSDPGLWFPWARLAAAGFGLWCAQPVTEANGIGDIKLRLQALGYDTSDPAAALAAFRRHFLGIESTAEPDLRDSAMLDCLISQKNTASP